MARGGSGPQFQSVKGGETHQGRKINAAPAGGEAERSGMRSEHFLMMGKIGQDVDEDVGDRDPPRSRQPYIARRCAQERYCPPEQMYSGEYERGQKGQE